MANTRSARNRMPMRAACACEAGGMGFGFGLVCLVTGVILVARVSAKLGDVDAKAIGVVLIVAGIAALALSLARRSSFGAPVGIGRRRP